MLPFGFVILPVTAYLLKRSPIEAMQVVNIFAVIYTSVLAFYPRYKWLQICITFPLVAVSRQLVYSTVFYMVGEYFGFLNYGVILGLINIVVSVAGSAQYLLTLLAEQNDGDYIWSILLLLLIPLGFAEVILRVRISEDDKANDKQSDITMSVLKKMRIEHHLQSQSEEREPVNRSQMKNSTSYTGLPVE